MSTWRPVVPCSRTHRTFARVLDGRCPVVGVYERVRTWGQRSRVGIPLSPHRMRHTFATHLVRAGVGLVTIRDLLGHRLITSTQIYLHVTADDLRAAAARHPIRRLLDTVKHLIAPGPLPFQKARPIYGSG